MDQDRVVAIACGVISAMIGLVIVFFAIAPMQWRVSMLVRMDPTEPLSAVAREADPSFAFVPGGHYDGVYAYAIAIDPLATSEAHELIDLPAYRYGRAAYGWLAGFLVAGEPALVPWSLFVVGLVSLALGAYGASRLAVELGWPAVAGLVVPLNPGVLLGLTVDTSEPLAIALAVWGILFWIRGRYLPALATMVVLGLVKEPFLAVPAGLFVWELVQAKRTGARIDRPLVRKLLSLAAVPIPLAAWWVYLFGVFGEWPLAQPSLVASPGYGWLDGLTKTGEMAALGNFDQIQNGVANLPLLMCVFIALILALLQAIRIRTPLDPVFIFLMLAFSVLSWWQLVFTKDMLRILAIPLSFLPAMLIHHVYEPRQHAPKTEP